MKESEYILVAIMAVKSELVVSKLKALIVVTLAYNRNI